MLNKRYISVILTVITICVGICGPAFSTETRRMVVDGVAAVVNDRTILASDIQKVIAPVHQQLSKKYKGDILRKKLKEAYAEALKRVVDRELILAHYDNPNPEALEKLIDERAEELIRQRFEGDRSAFLSALAEERITIDDWRAQLRDRFLVSIMQRQEIESKVTVSPGQIWARYREDIDQYKKPARIRLRMIVLKKGNGKDGTELKRTQADGIKKRLVDGAEFAALAKDFSEDVSAEDGGEIGWVEVSELKPELIKTASMLTAGQVSDVVEADDAFYILKADAHREAELTSLESVWNDIEREIRKEEYVRLYDAWIARLRKKSYVRVFKR